ncbi:MAG: 30S ribosomal protein S9 [Pirellulales bacterium]|nr:30S ribosomal protein S9 [Pirellulales bacterium]
MATAVVEEALGTGRRKSSVARVRVRAGSGKITINKRELDDYFTVQQDRNTVVAPLDYCEVRDSVDVIIRVHGGGNTGQAGACMQGIARALLKHDSDLTEKLREKQFLTRDSRMKERKKPGLHGARRGTQFSKR